MKYLSSVKMLFHFSLVCITVPLFTSAQSQYADSVIGYSSVSFWTLPSEVLGPPDTATCQATSKGGGWFGLTPDGQREWLEVSFANPQHVSTINIYETDNTDAVDTVYIRNAVTKGWKQVFSQTAHSDVCPKTLSITIPTTSYDVDAVRIAVNSPAVSGNNGIDGVEISTPPYGLLTLGTITGNKQLAGIAGDIVKNQQYRVAYEGDTNVNILKLDLPVTGLTGTLTLNAISVTSANVRDADIANVKLWLGTDTSIVSQIGTTQIFSGGAVTFSGLAFNLPFGDNYLWVTYDIAAALPVLPHIADAKINVGDIIITAAGGATNPGSQPAVALDPVGNVTIFTYPTFPADNAQRIYYFRATNNNNSGAGSISYIEDYTTANPKVIDLCMLPASTGIGLHNGLAANPIDNYLYFQEVDSAGTGIVIERVDTRGHITTACSLSTYSFFGTFDSRGNYWTTDNLDNLIAVDITTGNQVKGNFPDVSGGYLDCAYNPFDCYIYAAGVRFDTNGIQDVTYQQLFMGESYGAVAIGQDGYLYGIDGNNDLSVSNQLTDTSYVVWIIPGPTVTQGISDAASFPGSYSISAFFSAPNLCSGNAMFFVDSSQGPVNSWQWNFGDPASGTSNTSTLQNPTHVFSSFGKFNVTLNILSVNNLCIPIVRSDSTTEIITVFPTPPTPVITQRYDTLFCSTNNIYRSYQWYFNASLIPGATDTSYVVTQNGNYNVAVTDTNGCLISVGINILSAPPVASFQSSATSTCVNDCINFTDKSTNGPTSWQWSFPGGIPSSSADQNPQQICYDASGSYAVTLIVGNVSGIDTIITNNFIHVSPLPPAPVITKSNDTLYCSVDPSYTAYQWYLDTTLIVGATNSFYVTTQGGGYHVKVFNEYGCNNSASFAVGLQDYTSDQIIYMYPNPAGDQLMIGDLKLTRETPVDIYNVLGQIVQEERVSRRNTAIINVKNLAAGVYFVRVPMGEGRGTLVGKFVKE